MRLTHTNEQNPYHAGLLTAKAEPDCAAQTRLDPLRQHRFWNVLQIIIALRIVLSKICLVLLLASGSLALVGCGQKEESAALVTLYGYQGRPFQQFPNVTIQQRKPGYIKFQIGNMVIEHSGHYDVQNFTQ